MSNSENHNRPQAKTDSAGHPPRRPSGPPRVSGTNPLQFSHELIHPVRHIYVHIPFCARICPYCAFYKDLLDRSQTSRFCDALLRDLQLYHGGAVSPPTGSSGCELPRLLPFTIYFGGGTPTALNIAQLELLLRGFQETLDLSQ